MIPRLVAHRGDMRRYPENSLPGLEAALRAGACAIEFDLQMSADGHLVVVHDSDFQRTAGRPLSVFEADRQALASVSVHEPARFGDTFAPLAVPLLDEVLALLSRCPRASAFVEIKTQSLRHWGVAPVMDALLNSLEPCRRQCVVISFHFDALAYARRHGDVPLGWVIPRFDAHGRQRASALRPDYLIGNYRKIPSAERPWPGDWTWMLYDIDDPALALHYAGQGVELIETGNISALLQHPLLARGACDHGL